MSLMISNRQVFNAAQQLIKSWDRLREVWDDPVSQRIENRFIRPLHHDIHTAMTALEQMHEIMESAIEELATHEDAPYGKRRSSTAEDDTQGHQCAPPQPDH